MSKTQKRDAKRAEWDAQCAALEEERARKRKPRHVVFDR